LCGKAVTITDVDVEHRCGPPDELYTRWCLGCSDPWPCTGRLAALMVESDAGALHRQSAVGGICANCALPWPCPGVRRADGEEVGEEDVLALVEFGWRVAAWQRGMDPSDQRGTVIDVLDEAGVRTFTVLAWFQGRPRLIELQAGEIDPVLCSQPRLDAMRKDYRDIARQVGRATGPADEWETRWLHVALLLAQWITQPKGRR
jgi:hypothetical protein